jgi:murein DD-endopeptidase MepM/ murein hydrolase activator NlpD
MKRVFRFSIYLSLFLLAITSFTFADTTDEIKAKIDERNAQIKKLEEEIGQYNIEVNNAQGQSKTLQSTLKTLDVTKKKITTDISLTEKKIDKANLTIEELGSDIGKTGSQIDVNKEALFSALQSAEEYENTSLIEMILAKKDLGEIWSDIDDVKQVHDTIVVKSRELIDLKGQMESKQSAIKQQKSTLLGLKQDLSGKKQAVESTTQEKAKLLAQTQNKEQAFQALISDRQKQIDQFEKEIYQFESQLNIKVDKSGYPAPKNGILSWPLDNVLVTQKFGKTVGAEKLYVSGSHNGVDFRASIGTKVKNVLDGVVVGTGNTDAYPGCYSFGKWVMVKHGNGLSTIFGHLSVISVATGQELQTGDTIGYSGNTGYSTGPHLHISVYATQGVRIEKYTNSIGCKQATIPLADIKAYLDPLVYFPRT